jgi:ABC-type lipoprotein release transport system permease subunit
LWQVFVAEFSVSVDFIRKAGMTQLMTKIIYGISAIDPVTFVGVAIARTSIALAACYIPARHGMRADSMVALRYEQQMPATRWGNCLGIKRRG